MGLIVIKADAGALASGGEHGVTAGQGAERDGIKDGEFMKAAVFDLRAGAGGLEEGQVKDGIVPDQDGFAAAALLDLLLDGLEKVLQTGALGFGKAQRVLRIADSS